MPSAQYIENCCYYFILFVDGDLRIPVIRTVRYLGITQRQGQPDVLLFEDVDTDAQQRKLVFGLADAGDVVLDGPALINRLKKCFEGSLAAGGD